MRRWLFPAAVLSLVSLVAVYTTEVSRPRPSVSGRVMEIPLWTGDAPGAVGDSTADRPTMTVTLPPHARPNGTFVVVLPGGGYREVATATEGARAVRWLDSLGIASAVVRYRVAPRYHYPQIVQDAARAIRLVRAHAPEWGLDTARIGVLGFSAGGHLAATLGTHFDSGDSRATDLVERRSSRPSFMLLVYPLITMDSATTHWRSRLALLGPHPAPALVYALSEEKHVTAETPPAFLVTTNDDTLVPSENAVAMYAALHRAGVPAGLHIYDTHRGGRHGFAMATPDSSLSTWPRMMELWMRRYQLLDDSTVPPR